MSLDWPEPPPKKEVGHIYLKAPEPKKKGRCKHVAVGEVAPEDVTICPKCRSVCLVAEVKK